MKASSGAEFAAHDTNPYDRSLPQDLRFSQNRVRESRGRTAHCQPEFSFYSQSVEGLAQIVHLASYHQLYCDKANVETSKTWSLK